MAPGSRLPDGMASNEGSARDGIRRGFKPTTEAGWPGTTAARRSASTPTGSRRRRSTERERKEFRMVDFYRSLRTATQNPFARNIATRSSAQYALNRDADRNRHGFRALFIGQAQQPANQTPTPAPANNVPA